jgi:hypothetical protein
VQRALRDTPKVAQCEDCPGQHGAVLGVVDHGYDVGDFVVEHIVLAILESLDCPVEVGCREEGKWDLQEDIEFGNVEELVEEGAHLELAGADEVGDHVRTEFLGTSSLSKSCSLP